MVKVICFAKLYFYCTGAGPCGNTILKKKSIVCAVPFAAFKNV